MRLSVLFAAALLLGACRPASAEIAQAPAPTTTPPLRAGVVAEYGWFVPQGPRVQTLGEISSRRAVVDNDHRTTEILFSNPSGNPVTGGQSVLAVRFLMRIDCRTGDYVLPERSWLSGEGQVLATQTLTLPVGYFGPMDLVTREVCGGAAATNRETFDSVEDYVRQSGTRPAAPRAGPPRIVRPGGGT